MKACSRGQESISKGDVHGCLSKVPLEHGAWQLELHIPESSSRLKIRQRQVLVSPEVCAPKQLEDVCFGSMHGSRDVRKKRARKVSHICSQSLSQDYTMCCIVSQHAVANSASSSSVLHGRKDA